MGAKEARLKQLRTEQLKRWLVPRLHDLQLYRALRLHRLGWTCYLATALLLYTALISVQLLLFVLRLPLETISAPIAWLGDWLDAACTWGQRRLWTLCQAAANGPSRLACILVVVPVGGVCLGVLALLWSVARLLSTLSLGFLAKRLEGLRGHLKVGSMHAKWALGCLNQRPTKTDCCMPIQRQVGAEGGLLTETRLPWLEAFWLFLPADCELLEEAQRRLAATACLEAMEQAWSDAALAEQVDAVQEVRRPHSTVCRPDACAE